MENLNYSMGAVSSMPGDTFNAPKGARCERCGANALTVVQTETDGMGAEFATLCSPCLRKQEEEQEAWQNKPRACDYCKVVAVLRPRRDYLEEGSSGPVYQLCAPCCDRLSKAEEEEYRSYERDNSWGW